MNFRLGLPWTQKSYDSIWVVVDRLTNSARFISVKSTYLVEDYARVFLDKIFFNHGIPLSIILNRVAQFTLRFWRSFKKGLGTMVRLSTAFHPQTDGQVERLYKPLKICLGRALLI